MSDVPGIDSAIEYAAREMHRQLHGAGLYDQLGGLEQARWRRMAKAVNSAFREHNRQVAEEMVSEKDREWLEKLGTVRAERDRYRRSSSDASVELGVAIQERRQMQEALFAAWAERDRLRTEVATLQRSASGCSCRPVPASRTHGGGLDPECPSHGSGKVVTPSSDVQVEAARRLRLVANNLPPELTGTGPWLRRLAQWLDTHLPPADTRARREVAWALAPDAPVLAVLSRLVELRHAGCGTDEQWLKKWQDAWVEARRVLGETE